MAGGARAADLPPAEIDAADDVLDAPELRASEIMSADLRG